MNKFFAIRNNKVASPLLLWCIKIIFIIIFVACSISFLMQGTNQFTLMFPSYISNNRKMFSVEGESPDAPMSFNFTDFSDSLNKTGPSFWQSMKPSFACPPQLLTKVGGVKDGGKWTCGLNNLAKLNDKQIPCVVYSFGVNKDSTFEAEVLATTHCDVFAYDYTVDKIGHPLRPSNPRVHFEKLGIGGRDFGSIKTLKTLMMRNGGHKWIDILKIDVEGAEYSSLANILNDFLDNDDGMGLPFGQLLVEVHVFNWKEMDKQKSPKTSTKAEMVVNFFKLLEGRGLRMFYSEINTAAKTCCSEFSFINTNTFALKRILEY